MKLGSRYKVEEGSKEKEITADWKMLPPRETIKKRYHWVCLPCALGEREKQRGQQLHG